METHWIIFIFFLSFLAFMLPTFIAFLRRHRFRWIILILNLATGATVLGWFAVLLWAMLGDRMFDANATEDNTV